MAGFSIIKQQVVRRMFWGRGSLYRTSFHIAIMIFTVLLLVTGITSRFGVTEAKQALTVSYGTVGNNDFLEQGANLTTAIPIEDVSQLNYKVTKYTVQANDTLDTIASGSGVSKDTIKWANDKILSPFNDNLQPGWVLLIPQVDGVLHTAVDGDTVDSIAKLTGGNRFDIIELNSLVPPDYNINPGQKIFVPGGKITAPAYFNAGTGGYVSSGVYLNLPLGNLPAGTFDDPLTNPYCAGYVWMRGYTSWHNGVDLAHSPGCPVRAAAAGKVIYAGSGTSFDCDTDCGNYIIIDHGGGVMTEYLHGDLLWVKKGDYVQKDQDIMLMGCTGNCTGTHLHLTLIYNHRSIDPSPYIPYRRP